mgnify:CR=1 FL=1
MSKKLISNREFRFLNRTIKKEINENLKNKLDTKIIIDELKYYRDFSKHTSNNYNKLLNKVYLNI